MAGLITGIVIGALVLLLILSLIIMYNSLIRARNKVNEAFANVDVVLKKRYDLIPNLVNTVKGYMKHEKETLDEIVILRNKAMQSDDINEKVAINNKLSSSISGLFALAENYPNLKADTTFAKLQESLVDVENELSVVRTEFNSKVNTNNSRIDMFPTSILAKMFKFKHFDLFVVTDPKERENVIVEF